MAEFRAWYSAAELAGLPGMPATDRNVELRAERDGWERRWAETPRGHWEYSITSETFPAGTHHALLEAWRREQAELQPTRRKAADPFDDLPRYVRDRGLARRRILRALEEHAQDGLDDKVLEAFAARYRAREIELPAYVFDRIKTVDGRTLKSWRVSLERGGMYELASERRNLREPRGKVEQDEELRRIVLAAMFAHPAVDAGTIHEYLRAEHAELAAEVSPRTIQRFMARWKETHREEWLDLCAPDRWKNKFLAAFGSASESITRLNQLWELDDTPADLLLIDGRHVLSGVIDVYSRRVKLLVAKTSRAETVAAVFRRGLIEWGVPEQARMDNGQNFKSVHVQTLLRKLEVDIIHCTPFASEQKPFVERVFRTFSHDLVELLPGYCGHNVAERRDIEARKAFAQRVMTPGETIEVQMTSEQLQSFCDRWCESVYGRNAHDGLGGRTPFEVAAAWREPVRRIPDPRALDVLLAPAPGGGRTVRKKGIELEGAWFIHADLSAWIGQRVEVRLDPTDLGRVFVFGPDHEFVCIAENPERTGLDRRAVARVAKAKQKARRAELRKLNRDTKKVLHADLATAILEMREREAESVVQGPRPTVEHQTAALTGAADAVAARAELAAPRAIVHDPETLRRGAESIARFESERDRLRRIELEDAAQDEADWQRAVQLEASPVMTTEERKWLDGFKNTPLYRGRKHRQRVAAG